MKKYIHPAVTAVLLVAVVIMGFGLRQQRVDNGMLYDTMGLLLESQANLIEAVKQHPLVQPGISY